MRRLIIMRHAQAGPGHPDVERTLTDMGQRQAAVMGRNLNIFGPVDLALVSSATRTRQTYEALKDGGLIVSNVTFDDQLYLAGQYGVLEQIQKIPSAINTALFVGHEPTTTALTSLLSTGHTRAGREASRGFSPANAAVLEFTVPWSGLEMRGATVTDFLGPTSS